MRLKLQTFFQLNPAMVLNSLNNKEREFNTWHNIYIQICHKEHWQLEKVGGVQFRKCYGPLSEVIF